jgi:hypothetical protein
MNSLKLKKKNFNKNKGILNENKGIFNKNIGFLQAYSKTIMV